MYDFETLVRRSGIGNLKDAILADVIREKGLISFAAAEMDFKTAPSLIEAVVNRAETGLLGFTLKEESYLSSVAWWMAAARNWTIDTSWVVPALGTIFSVATAIRLKTVEGEGVIIQPPVYNRYEQAAKRLRRKVVYNPLVLDEGQYKIDFHHLEACMAEESNKVLVICNPHNPIAKVWPENDLKSIAYLAKKYKVTVFSDEIFAEITFDGNHTVPYVTVPEAEQYGIVSTSLGKAFNLTGVNHANIIIPNKDLREAFIEQRNADHFGSIDPLVHAAVCGAYSKEGLDWLKAMCAYVDQNIKYLKEYIDLHLCPVKIMPVEGSFVVWLDLRGLGLCDADLMYFLREEAFLSVNPGRDFGENGNGFVRMNVATPRLEIEKAIKFLTAAMRKRGFQ